MAKKDKRNALSEDQLENVAGGNVTLHGNGDLEFTGPDAQRITDTVVGGNSQPQNQPQDPLADSL